MDSIPDNTAKITSKFNDEIFSHPYRIQWNRIENVKDEYQIKYCVTQKTYVTSSRMWRDELVLLNYDSR